ncbi:MAG: Wzz/FepE/Etk N-terminal domain-containing protein, partial [Bacillota bacterium]
MNEPEHYDEYEIDLREYIMLLWNAKWFIIGLCIIAVITAGVYTVSFTEPKYEADASLLIMPPTYTTSLDVSTLPINTYQNIALTDTIKQEIIDELDLKREDGSSYTVANLENKMTLEVSRQETDRGEANGSQYPFFVMKVKGVDPERCSEIANTWANKFMKASEDIRKGEVKEVSSVIIEQFEDTEKELNTAREELKDFKKESRLELKNSKLDILKTKLSEYENKYLSLETDLGSEKTKLKEMKSQLNNMKNDGEWAGKLSIDKKGNSILNKNKQNYLEAQEKLLAFKQNNDQEILQEEIETELEKLNKYQNEKIELEINKNSSNIDQIIKIREELSNAEAKLAHLRKELNKRQVKDDWKGLFEKDFSQDEFETPALKAKNDYREAQKELLKFKDQSNLGLLKQKISIKENKLENYKKRTSSLEEKLNDLKTTNEEIKVFLDKEPKKLELKKSLNEDSFWSNVLEKEKIEILKELSLTNEIINPLFEKLKNNYTDNQIKIESIPNQLKYYNENISKTESELKKLKNDLETKNQKLKRLQDNLEHYYSIYNNYEKNYKDLVFDFEKTKLKINSLEEQLKSYKKFEPKEIKDQIEKYEGLIEEQKSRINKMKNKLYELNQQEDRLKSDLDNYKKIYQNEVQTYR